jgi:Na+/H+ antiporter NhaA
MGLLAPSIPRLTPELIDSDQLMDLSDADAARTTAVLAKGSVSVVEWLQHVLHPWTSYVIVPIFALANSGIEISGDGLRDAARSPITWGVFFGLLAGKPLGIVLATRAAVRGGLADSPDGSVPRQIVGIGAAAGIGFTVALFITELAFTDPTDRSNAKLAILLASVLAAAASSLILTTGARHRTDATT